MLFGGIVAKIKRQRKPDPVRIQIAIAGKKPKGVCMTRALMDDIIEQRIMTGRLPKGLKVTSVRWINPSRKDGALARWKEASTPATIRKAFDTLRMAQLLQGGMRFRSVGSLKGVR